MPDDHLSEVAWVPIDDLSGYELIPALRPVMQGFLRLTATAGTTPTVPDDTPPGEGAPARALRPCGTYGAYQRHRKAGTEARTEARLRLQALHPDEFTALRAAYGGSNGWNHAMSDLARNHPGEFAVLLAECKNGADHAR